MKKAGIKSLDISCFIKIISCKKLRPKFSFYNQIVFLMISGTTRTVTAFNISSYPSDPHQTINILLEENRRLQAQIDRLTAYFWNQQNAFISENEQKITEITGFNMQPTPSDSTLPDETYLIKKEEYMGDNTSQPENSSFFSSLIPKKEEIEVSSFIVDQQPEISTSESETSSEENRIRNRLRNGFKQSKNKQNKQNSVINRSKAKHLWVTYGRKIISYALNNTKGDLYERIVVRADKLATKKGYSEVFMIKANDTIEEKCFKMEFGKIALEFVEKYSEEEFKSSNYMDNMISQKGKVAAWIKSRINQQEIKHEN